MSRENKRNLIIQAAESLFVSRHFHEVTMDDVAQAAKVAKGTLYLYFHDKDDLFFQTATAGFDELCAQLRTQIPVHLPFDRRLVELCRQIDAFFSRRRQLIRLMHEQEGPGGELHKRMLQHRQTLISVIAEILADGQRHEMLRHDIAADRLARLLLGMLGARAREQEHGDHEVSFLELVDFYLHGASANCMANLQAEDGV